MQTISDATDERSYRAAFAEAFMDMGVRFMVPTIEVLKHGDEQQIQVMARYTDGTTRDVTLEAFIESGDTETGL